MKIICSTWKKIGKKCNTNTSQPFQDTHSTGYQTRSDSPYGQTEYFRISSRIPSQERTYKMNVGKVIIRDVKRKTYFLKYMISDTQKCICYCVNYYEFRRKKKDSKLLGVCIPRLSDSRRMRTTQSSKGTLW